MKVLVTGSAGFIGSHVALRLLDRGDEVIGLDSLNDYYDVNLKKARLARFMQHPAIRMCTPTWPIVKPWKTSSPRTSRNA